MRAAPSTARRRICPGSICFLLYRHAEAAAARLRRSNSHRSPPPPPCAVWTTDRLTIAFAFILAALPTICRGATGEPAFGVNPLQGAYVVMTFLFCFLGCGSLHLQHPHTAAAYPVILPLPASQ